MLSLEFSYKFHGLDPDGEHMLLSLGFGDYSKIVRVPLEQARNMIDEREAEKARKEEAAKFNQFRRGNKK